jgi:predicted dehydrogenase
VGLLGTGWIGRARLKSLLDSELVSVVALADPSADALDQARAMAPGAKCLESFAALLGEPLDAVVISTPSALHPLQCQEAFQRGLAVFCQKPVACTAADTRAVVQAARRADRLLRADFCYRETEALGRVRQVVRAGEIGRVFAAELVFHNAYGPDKSWARDPALAGGGCAVDLGVHLIDAALFVLGSVPVVRASSQLHAHGRLLTLPPSEVEDFASASLELASGTTLSLSCSWQSSFGDHARIRAAFYGTSGGVAFENVGGSFFDFACDRYRGASRERLVEGPDDWSGRAIVAWANELRESASYRAVDELIEVSAALDALYGRNGDALPLASAMPREHWASP